MSHKKFALPPARVGFTIVKNDGALWHLVNIDEEERYHWLEVIQNKDGTFCCTHPNRTMISDSPLKDEA
ncbi:hypothetical protein BH10CYA1_BH10CYA1_54910 [soil metagenome]